MVPTTIASSLSLPLSGPTAGGEHRARAGRPRPAAPKSCGSCSRFSRAVESVYPACRWCRRRITGLGRCSRDDISPHQQDESRRRPELRMRITLRNQAADAPITRQGTGSVQGSPPIGTQGHGRTPSNGGGQRTRRPSPVDAPMAVTNVTVLTHGRSGPEFSHPALRPEFPSPRHAQHAWDFLACASIPAPLGERPLAHFASSLAVRAIRPRRKARSTSSSEATTVRPGAGAIGATEGTATTWQPAASAAATPVAVSSTTAQPAGSAPSPAAASRYGSGCGLVRATSSPATVSAKCCGPSERGPGR